MACLKRREDLNQRANWHFNHLITTCPKCGSQKGIEKVEGNTVTLEYCGWCETQWRVKLSIEELKEKHSYGEE